MASSGDTSLLESRAPTVKAVMWVMAIVPLLVVMMRLYVRFYLRRVFGWDDGIAVAAIVRAPYLYQSSTFKIAPWC
jgi:hypothetical protein